MDFGGLADLDFLGSDNYSPTSSLVPSSGAGDMFSFSGPGRGSSPAPSGAQDWFSSFKNAASDVYGASPNKSGEGGSGFRGFLSGFGDVAKAVMPIAQIGGGIANFMAQQDAMSQLKRTGKMQEQASRVALDSATAARPMADEAASISRDIRGVAGKVDPLAERAAGVGPSIRAAGENVRSGIVSPVQQYAAERLGRAQRGEVPEAIEAQLVAVERGEIQKLQDYFARAGIGDSSMMQQVLGEAKARTASRRAEWLMKEEQGALSAFDQARVGEATAASIFGGEGASYGNAANIYGSEVNDLARAAESLGIGGNILTNAGRTAGGVSSASSQESQQIEQLIAAAQQALAKMSGGSA